MRINADEHGHFQTSNTINFDFQSDVDLAKGEREIPHTKALPQQDRLVCRRMPQSVFHERHHVIVQAAFQISKLVEEKKVRLTKRQCRLQHAIPLKTTPYTSTSKAKKV